MTIIQFISLTPLIIISLAPIIIMISIAFRRSHGFTFIVSVFSLITAIYTLNTSNSLAPVFIPPLLIIDTFSLFFMGLLFAAGICILILSYNYFRQQPGQKEEFYILFFVAILGTAVLTACNHFVSLFLGIEMLSVSLYAMIAYMRHRDLSMEAGVKYLILAGASSAFLLFGMALIYTQYGKMGFDEIAEEMSLSGTIEPLALAGFIMLTAGIGFKLAVVPFHTWTPDVYQGAPAPVTAFIASVSKGGVFAFLLRFFYVLEGYNYQPMILIFSVIAIASMFTGNILALLQKNIKRLLAYSSISHLGYMLIAVIASEYSGIRAGAFYMLAYFIMIIGAFGIISVMSGSENDTDDIESYKGLYWKRPWIALVFSAMLFSLAGIPLSIGFFGKFYLISAGIESYSWLLVIMLVINSAISIYYYLRLVVAMFSQTPESDENNTAAIKPSIALGSSLVLAALLILLIWYGIYPSGIIEIIDKMVIL